MKILQDKVAIITGSGSGIGAAAAKLFAKNGATVVVSDINIDQAQNIADQIKSEGNHATMIAADVSAYEQIQNLVDQTVNTLGQVDILVNNAGIINKTMVKTANFPVDEWHKLIAINQTGVFYGMQCALKQMIKQGHGNIVNVASLAGLKAMGRSIGYSASKFAVVGMTKSAALEYASKNIRINCVCPAYTQSALLEGVFEIDEQIHDRFMKYMPMKRFGDVEEIAESILWLASAKTSFVTGQALTVCGGSSL